MIQQEPRLVGTPFFAMFDPSACWLADLEPHVRGPVPFEPARYEAVPDGAPIVPRSPTSRAS